MAAKRERTQLLKDNIASCKNLLFDTGRLPDLRQRNFAICRQLLVKTQGYTTASEFERGRIVVKWIQRRIDVHERFPEVKLEISTRRTWFLNPGIYALSLSWEVRTIAHENPLAS